MSKRFLQEFLNNVKADIETAAAEGSNIRVQLYTEKGDLITKTVSAEEAKSLDLSRLTNLEFIGKKESQTEELVQSEEDEDPITAAMKL
jgi:uncharacterized membrane protein YdbT with pleckstrin-like domain